MSEPVILSETRRVERHKCPDGYPYHVTVTETVQLRQITPEEYAAIAAITAAGTGEGGG